MRRLVTDTLIIAERNLIRLPRAPELLIAFTIQPIMFVLLFRYVFGGAIRTPGYSYVDFLIPGIIAQNTAFGGFATALGLNEDVSKGLIDRFRSLPMSRAAVLGGRTLSDIATNLKLTDMETCYKVFRKEVLQGIQIRSDRFGFEPEITAKIAKHSWRIYEVPITYAGRTYEEGKKITWKDGVQALWCIIRFKFSD